MARISSLTSVIVFVLASIAAIAAVVITAGDAAGVASLTAAALAAVICGVAAMRKEVKIKNKKVSWVVNEYYHKKYEEKLRAKTLSYRLFGNLSKWREIFQNFKQYEQVCKASIIDAYNKKYCHYDSIEIYGKKYSSLVEAVQDGYKISPDGDLIYVRKNKTYYGVFYKDKIVCINDKKHGFYPKYSNEIHYKPFDDERRLMKQCPEYLD